MPVTLLSLPSNLELAKPSKTAVQTAAEAGTTRYQSPVVAPQVASLNSAISSNGFALNQVLDSVAVAGVISTIGQPVHAEQGSLISPKANSSAVVDASLQKSLSTFAQTASNAQPISSLAEVAIGYPARSAVEFVNPALQVAQRLSEIQVAASETQAIDLSLMSLGAPVSITPPTDGPAKITVINSAATPVRIVDFKVAQTLPDSFVNTNLANLNLALPTATVTSLSSTERVDFTVTGIEISSGITVSGTADGPSITLLVAGDRASNSPARMNLSEITNANFAADMNAIAVNFAAELTPLFLAELGSAPAGEFQIRLTGTVSYADADIPPGTLILGG